MQIININSPIRHNIVPITFYQEHDIIVCVPKGKLGELNDEIIERSKLLIEFDSFDDIQDKLRNFDVIDECRIFCCSEDYMLIAALLRENFDISGMNVSSTEVFRDKTMMKKQAKKKGVRVPQYEHLVPEITFAKISNHVGLPFVVKPVDGAGAFGVFIIKNEEEYKEFSDNLASNIAYEYEEYISGILYHVDVLMQDGDVIFETVCENSSPNLEFQFGKACISLILPEKDEISVRLKKFARKVLDALNYRNGPSHIEIFVSDSNEVIFLEAAARTPGAVIVPLYQEKFCFNMIEQSLNIELGYTAKVPLQYNSNFLLSGITPLKQGVVNQINRPQIISEYKADIYCHLGQKLDCTKSLRNVSGTIIASNICYQTLRKDFEYLRSFNYIEVENSVA